MGISFYDIPRSQIIPPEKAHIDTIQTAKIWYLKLEKTNLKRLRVSILPPPPPPPCGFSKTIFSTERVKP